MIPVTKPFLPTIEEYQNLLKGIWSRNWLTNNGPLVNELELKLKEYLNVNRQLTNAKRHQLCRLFIKPYLVTIRRYKQDYLLEADVPIYQLFRANFPGISKAEGEGGVFLENIYKFIKAMPEYRRDIKVMSR